jgi:hypothetical protein
MNYREYQEAFDVIKEFYDHAWNNLILAISIGFGVIGIILPVVWGVIQYQLNKGSIQKLKKELKEYKTKFKKLEQEAQETKGGLFLMQGNIQFSHDFKLESVVSWLKALLCFIDIDDIKHIHLTNDLIYNSYDDISIPENTFETCPELKLTYQEVIQKLQAKNSRGRYDNIIIDIQEKMKCPIQQQTKE